MVLVVVVLNNNNNNNNDNNKFDYCTKSIRFQKTVGPTIAQTDSDVVIIGFFYQNMVNIW